MKGWIGVDFDGTLARYDGWVSPTHCGEPIGPMVSRVKSWLAEGREVRVFTARVFPITQVISTGGDDYRKYGLGHESAVAAAVAIQAWCAAHIGAVLPITCVKDYGMIELYDDRAVQVRPNTGELVGNSTRGL